MIAVTALISRSIGEGQRNLARSQAGAGIVIAAVVQGSVALLILFFRLELVQLAGAEGKNALDAARYLGLTIMSLVPMAIGLTCSGALRAESLGTKGIGRRWHRAGAISVCVGRARPVFRRVSTSVDFYADTACAGRCPRPICCRSWPRHCDTNGHTCRELFPDTCYGPLW